MNLLQQIKAMSEPRSTKQDFIDYYQFKYGNAWKRQATIAISGTSDLKSKAYKNASRNFQARNTETSKKSKEGNTSKWHKLTENLPPKPPDNGYHIDGTIWVQYSDECEEREIHLHITGSEASQLLNGGFNAHSAVVNNYNEMDIDSDGYSPCNESAWKVTVN